MLDWLKD